MITPESFLYWATQIAMGLLLMGMVLVLGRLALGPRAADRVVAIDLLTVMVLAFLVVAVIHSGEKSFLDVAIAFACIAFLGSIALARFLLRAYRQYWCAITQEKNDD